MSLSIKHLRGKRVLIEKPEMAKSSIELTESAQASMEKEMIAKWTRLTIAAVGTDVTDIKAGDEVYANAGMLSSAEQIELDGKLYMLVPDHSIAIVY
jgi:hypothetical protein